LIEEFDSEGSLLYPKGGMSSYIRGLVKKCEDNGVDLRLRSRVSMIKYGQNYEQEPFEKYQIYDYQDATSPIVASKNLIISVPPFCVKQMSGDVISYLTEQREFQVIKGVPVFTYTNFYEDDSWFRFPTQSESGIPPNLFRGITSDHCGNCFEIPQEPSIATHPDIRVRSVFRPIYSDKPGCVEYFKYLSGNKNCADSKVESFKDLRNISSEFLNVFFGQVPEPIASEEQYWPVAWH